MHVADETQVLPVPARLADGAAPFLNGLEDLELHARRSDRGALGEAANQLVQKILGADLQVEGITAVLDTYIQQVEGEQRDIGVAVVDHGDDGHRGLARGRALLGIDQVGDFEIQGEIGLVVVRTAGGLNKTLEL